MAELMKPPSLNNSFGALLIGALISGVLFGVATAQWYWYHLAYPNDSRWLKGFVALTWGWDFIQQVLISHTIYFYLVKNFFNPAILNYHVWSICWQVLPETFVCASVQGFFTYRIWKSSRSDFKATLIFFPSLLIVAKFALGIAYCVKGNQIKTITQAINKLHPISLSLNAIAATTDITIAITMFLILRSMRAGFSITNSVLALLMIYTVNTGVITSVAALSTFVVQISLYHKVIYAGIYFITSKLYLNTMLASLNSREKIANKLRTEYHIQSSITSIVFVDQQNASSEAAVDFSGLSCESPCRPAKSRPRVRDSSSADTFSTNTSVRK